MTIYSETQIQAALVDLQSLLNREDLLAREISVAVTITSELAYNIVKYAGRGNVTVRVEDRTDERWITIIAEDRGPGIGDLDRAMEDHYSSKGTLGLGLPGVRRMADEFQVETALHQGTKVKAGLAVRGKPTTTLK
jgi:serine/threonine-protein kinase RsbT